MNSAKIADDPLAAKYWAVVEELPLMDLREKEAKIFRAILDEQFRARKPFWRATQKQDVSVLTLLAKQNLAEPLEALKVRGMVQWWETSSGWVFQAVMDPTFWNARPSEIDRRVYYRALSGVRALNAFDDPDPALPTLEEPKGLSEALGEITNFAPTRSLDVPNPQGTGMAGDYHQDRGRGRDAGMLQGDNRESAPANAVQSSGAEPGEPGSASEPEGREQGAAKQSGIPKLIQQMRACADGGGIDTTAEQAGHKFSAVVLKSSTETRSRAPEAQGPVLDSITRVLDSITGDPEAPPGEYSNQVLARGRVLDSSTPVLKSSTANNEHCFNASSKKHLTLLTLFCDRLKRAEVVLERGMQARQIAKYLEEAGVFEGPAGEYYAPFWYSRLKHHRQAVEACFFQLIEQVQLRGIGSIDTPGAFMMDRMKRCGAVKWNALREAKGPR